MKYLLVCLVLLISCKQPDYNNHKIRINKTSNHSITIIPYKDFPNSWLPIVKSTLEQYYNSVKIAPSISLPTTAYNKSRNRYRADSLIKFQSKLAKKNETIIGLTTKDISTTKNDKSDWGVMGLGFMPGNACVVSTFRLNKKNIKSQLYKVCLHEIGHTEGLPHCEKKFCYMRDAEGQNHHDEETQYCNDCLEEIDSKL